MERLRKDEEKRKEERRERKKQKKQGSALSVEETDDLAALGLPTGFGGGKNK